MKPLAPVTRTDWPAVDVTPNGRSCRFGFPLSGSSFEVRLPDAIRATSVLSRCARRPAASGSRRTCRCRRGRRISTPLRRTCPQHRRRPAARESPQLLGDHRRDQLPGDLAAVVELALGRADPLPDLRARDLGGRGVLHQVEDRHAPCPASQAPIYWIADVDVVAQARLGDRRFRLELEQVGGASTFTSSRCFVAIWFGAGMCRSNTSMRDRHEARVRDPGAVVAVGRFALLVGAHFRERRLVGRRRS